MKNFTRLSILLLSSLLLLGGCKGKKQNNNPTLDDVSFPDEDTDDPSRPGIEVLPNVGDDAVNPLEITANPSYFDNISLHNMPGQWSGYGVHYPSIYKFNSTYYLYQSTPDSNVGIRALKSTDLVNWEYATAAGFPLGYITKDKLTYGAKAPQVFKYDDSFYLMFKSSSGYVLFNSNTPEGPFEYHSSLGFDSKYICRIFNAPNGNLFLISGSEKAVEIYEMDSINKVNQGSRAVVSSTAISEYFGESAIADSPYLSDINGVAYLTYSSQDESLVSYRTYLVSAINPDYSSSVALANSFFNQGTGPILVNTNADSGARGLGDVSLVEGPDLASYYALYTSYESATTRRFNIAPVSLSSANINIAHRDTSSYTLTLDKHLFVDDDEKTLVLSNEVSENDYSAQFTFRDVDKVYFGYQTSSNYYSIEFDKPNHKASLVLTENGLVTVLKSVSYLGDLHEVKVSYSSGLFVTLDGLSLANNLPLYKIPYGKIGYLKSEHSYLGETFFVNSSSIKNTQENVKLGEGNIYANMYLSSQSNISNIEELKLIDNPRNDLYGSSYLNMTQAHDYARFLVDVKEDGRYGIELIYNVSFGKNSSVLGLRLGLNNEVMYRTTPIGENGFVRTLTAEFNATHGVNELLIENLSNDELKLVAARLVKVSSYTPSYSNLLDNYATTGVRYVTDFRINKDHKAHETYEGARCFAYVGDDTITDFTMEVEVGFLGGTTTAGFVGIAFRCDNFASSSLDGDESLVGYYLEISQYQTRLMKHNYGYGQTIGVADLTNTIGDFAKYKIVMKQNTIRIYKEEIMVFVFEDQFAFSSGHLGFGSCDTNGLIRKINIKAAE